MSKKVALWLMVGGAAVSLYDAMAKGKNDEANPLYGPGKPLESFRWKVYTSEASGTAPEKNYYISVSDIAAIVGASFYFAK